MYDNKKLKNKGLWRSSEKWKFKPKEYSSLIYIENISKTKVLEAKSDGKVKLENFEEGKAEQLWTKGEPDTDFDGAEI